MNWILAVDPGDKHVGWATWLNYGTSMYRAGELEAKEAPDWIDTQLGATCMVNQLVVIEEFRLYGHKAQEQTWSQMSTSEMIGAIKWVCKRRGVPWVEQGASILVPTEAQLRARGIELIQAGPHAKSAQLHLWHYLLKNELERRAS